MLYFFLVALARVYYHCHWFGDCIAGIAFGATFCYFMYTIGFIGLIKGIVYPIFCYTC